MKKRLNSVVLVGITLAVLLFIIQAAIAQPEGRRRGDDRKGNPVSQETMEQMDTNGDNKISAEEFKGPDDKFKKMDADGDGFVTSEEFNKRAEKKNAPAPPPPETRQRERGERGERRRFDPAQMQERMLEGIKERLSSTDEEWTAIKPLVSNVLDARMKTRMGGWGFRGRRGGSESEGVSEVDDLRAALDSEESKPEDIKKKLVAYRELRKKNEAELKKSQDELIKVLSVKQEAQMVLMGMLD